MTGLHIHVWIQQQYESSIGDNSQIRSIVFRKRNEEVAFALHKWRTAWNATLLHYPSSKPALYQKSAIAFWYPLPPSPPSLPPTYPAHWLLARVGQLYSYFCVQVPRKVLQRSQRRAGGLRGKPPNPARGPTSAGDLHDDRQWQVEREFQCQGRRRRGRDLCAERVRGDHWRGDQGG